MTQLFRYDKEMNITLLDKIKLECSDFIGTCGDLPLIKVLRETPNNFKKVKVRTKDKKNDFIEAFNEAFESDYRNIHGRSIFCNGRHMMATNEEGFEPVYVFPINGFKYLHNPNISYHEEYKKIYDTLNQSMTGKEADELFVDMIEYSYQTNIVPFYDALFSKKEVIIYGIPYYYSVRVKKFPIYEDLLSLLKD